MIAIVDEKLVELLGPEDLREIELLLYRETEFLDLGLYDRWLELFCEDCTYWVPASPDQTDPLDHISLFYEDRTLMEMRIRRLQHPRAHSLSMPLRTSHLTGTAVIKGSEDDGDTIVARSRFTMMEYHRDQQRQFAGSYTYNLRRVNERYRIRTKRVDLINCDSILEPLQTFI